MDTADRRPVLAVAANAREFAGLLRHASEVCPIEAPIGMASRARIAESEWLLAANGEGPRLAAQAVGWALDQSIPRAVVSTGFCGALDPRLRAADIWTATEVRNEQGARYAALEPRSRRSASRGPVLSIDRVAATRKQKEELRRTGAGVVEMEAMAVAGAAETRSLPFYCIRAVSDRAGADLPLDFNRYRGAGGRISTSRIVLGAALRPWTWVGLIRLARDASRASRALGDYLAECRF
jgi:adenosylhomocysteine nucleosidase